MWTASVEKSTPVRLALSRAGPLLLRHRENSSTLTRGRDSWHHGRRRRWRTSVAAAASGWGRTRASGTTAFHRARRDLDFASHTVGDGTGNGGSQRRLRGRLLRKTGPQRQSRPSAPPTVVRELKVMAGPLERLHRGALRLSARRCASADTHSFRRAMCKRSCGDPSRNRACPPQISSTAQWISCRQTRISVEKPVQQKWTKKSANSACTGPWAGVDIAYSDRTERNKVVGATWLQRDSSRCEVVHRMLLSPFGIFSERT